MTQALFQPVPTLFGFIVAAALLFGLWYSRTTHCFVAAMTALLLLNAWHLDEVYLAFGSIPNASGTLLFVPAMAALMMCAGRHGTQAARQVLNAVCLGLMILMVTNMRFLWYALFVSDAGAGEVTAFGDVRDTFLVLVKFHFAGSIMLLVRRELTKTKVPRALWGTLPVVGAAILTLPINLYSVHFAHPDMNLWPVALGTIFVRSLVALFCSGIVLLLVATTNEPIDLERRGRFGLG